MRISIVLDLAEFDDSYNLYYQACLYSPLTLISWFTTATRTRFPSQSVGLPPWVATTGRRICKANIYHPPLHGHGYGPLSLVIAG